MKKKNSDQQTKLKIQNEALDIIGIYTVAYAGRGGGFAGRCCYTKVASQKFCSLIICIIKYINANDKKMRKCPIIIDKLLPETIITLSFSNTQKHDTEL